jgi:hypothetical protein
VEKEEEWHTERSYSLLYYENAGSGRTQNILFVPWRICKKIERRMN